jgi:cyanophycin synthetase
MRIEGIRALEGPNVHHRKPVLVMTLRLEELTGRESRELPGFSERLLELLPGLGGHVCSRGYAGGFVERLHEGTYFGHVIEHVALELAARLGSQATYGKTRHAGEHGLYDVIVRYESEQGMRFLLETAVSLVAALAAGEDYPLAGRLEQAERIITDTRLGPSTRAIVAAAEKRGIPWRRLSDGSLVEFGHGRNRKLIQAALSGETSQIAVDTAGDKELTKRLLRDAFLPVPAGIAVDSPEGAVAAFRRLRAPVVLKPQSGNQGRGVTLGLMDEEQVRQAFSRAAAVSGPQVLLEEQLEGKDYRVLVVAGKMVAASLRVPGHVTGDGQHTLEQLIELTNQDPRRGESHEKPLTKIRLDESFSRTPSGYARQDVPAAGEKVFLNHAANLSLGGTATDVTDLVHPGTRLICERAARVVTLDICGVDLITADIALPFSGGIVELNAGPGLRMHLYPSEGEARAVGEAIMDHLYPPGSQSRIPLCAVTGTNGKTTVTRLIGHVMNHGSTTVGMTTTDGVHIGGLRIAEGDMTGPASARVVLSDPTVDLAVLETARGGILRRGLAYDWSDVAVITNIRPDHIGQDGIEDLDDLVWIKSLVAERVREGGTLILNADDPETVRLATHRRDLKHPREIVLFSTRNDNPHVRRHLQQGGKACLVEDGWLTEAQGNCRQRLLLAAAVPLTHGGTAQFQVANCLAALAACRALGCRAARLVRALQTFEAARDNPGRMNLWRFGQGHLLVDYGHNPDAFRAAGRMMRQWNRPVIGIVGVPGDRSDGLIREAARAAARAFDKILIREDDDLRERQPGEVAALLSHTIRSEAPALECRVVPDEIAGIREALADVAAGATAVVFYERLAPLVSFLKQAGAEPTESLESAGDEPDLPQLRARQSRSLT